MVAFAYSTITWTDSGDVEVAFEQIAAAGWDAVELFDIPLDQLGPGERLRGIADMNGLRVASMFGVFDDLDSPRGIESHKKRIDYAAALGVDLYGVVGPTRLRERPPTSSELRRLADYSEGLATYGRDRGVRVAYHPHVACWVERHPQIEQLMAMTSDLGLCLDTSHVGLVGEDTVSHLRQYRDRVAYVHLKDWGNGNYVELGSGTLGIEFASVLEAMDALGQRLAVVEQSWAPVSAADSAKRNADHIRRLGYQPGQSVR